MANSINSKAKEYYDNDDTGGSLNSNLKDFLVQQGATGNSINTLWRDYAYGEGGTSLNTRLRNLWGTSGSLMKRWKDTLGLTWDEVKALFNFRDTDPDFLLDGSAFFDDTNDYISLTPVSPAGTWSISFWFKATVEDNGAIYTNVDGTSNYISIGMWDGKIQMNCADTGGTDRATTSTYNDGVWHHAVLIKKDTSNCSAIYIDGELASSDNSNTWAGTNSRDEHTIGVAEYSSDQYYGGRIACLGLWNRELSESEIESIYWRGSYSELKDTELTNLVAWYNLASTSAGSELITNGDFSSFSSGQATSWTTTGSPTLSEETTIVQSGSSQKIFMATSGNNGIDQAITTVEGAEYTFSAKVYVTGGRARIILDNGTDDGQTYVGTGGTAGYTDLNTWHTVSFTKTSQSTTMTARLWTSSANTTVYVDDVSLKLVSETPDSVGTNHGAVAGATINTDSYSGESPFKPRIQDKAAPKMAVQLADGSTSFDGSNDYISISTSASSNWTFSVWAKAGFTDSSWHELYDKNPSSGGRITIAIVSNKFQMYDTAYRDSGYTLSDKNWHHYVITQTGTALNFYVDGSHQATVTGSGHSLGGDAHIGRYYPLAIEYWNGSMANVALYSSALTQTQIQELMFTEKYSGLSADLKTNLVSWYDMGSSSNPHNDLEGGNHGTNNGATVNTGYTHSPHGVVDALHYSEVYSGRAVSYDGSNDYVDGSASNEIITGNNVTYSVWFKNTDNHTAYLLMNQRASGDNNLSVRLNNTAGEVDVFVWDGSSEGTLNYDPSTNDSKWHHLAFTTTASAQVLYIDGVAVATGTLTFSNSASSDVFSIGRKGGGGNYFGGSISNVKVFNSVLTQAQVQELYTKPETVLPTGVSASNLKLDLPMQEGAGSYVYDGSGNQNHGTINGASWATGQEYGYQASLVRSNTPMIFDGNDDKVTISDAGVIQNIWDGGGSISCWIYPNSDGEGNGGRIFEKVEYVLQVASESAGKVSLNFYYDFSGTDGNWFTTSTEVSINEWSHIVVTYNADSVSNNPIIYVNGSSVTLTESSTPTSAREDDSGDDLYIGNNSGGTRTFDGLINDFSVWDTILDADAVTALYNSGTPLLPTSDSGNYDNSGNLVGYWRNDGNTTWTDRSTNSNNGTASGSPVSIVIPEGSTSGRDNQGFLLSDTTTISNGARFFSNEEYIKIQDSEILQDIFDGGGSIDAWVYINSAGESGTGRILDKRASGAGWMFYTDFSGGNNVRFFQEFSTTDGRWDMGITTGEWNHLVVTYDNSSTSNNPVMYLNGVSQTVTEIVTPVGTSLTDVGQDLYIGNASGGGYNFDGKIDEVKIYKKVLSASEVSKNYTNGLGKHS